MRGRPTLTLRVPQGDSPRRKYMKTSEKLQTELEKVLSGRPWYGPNIYDILDQVTFESAYERAGHAHTIAELILHMLSWTEEVIDRMNEKPAGLPRSGIG